MNAVTAREIRERFRRGRSVYFFVAWLVGMLGMGYLMYLLARVMVSPNNFGGGFGVSPLLVSSRMGKTMLELLLILLMAAVVLVVPGLGAMSVVGERDRLTLQLLQVSQLSPFQIILGKLNSSLIFLALLVVSLAPLLVLPTVFGGVTMRDVLAGFGMIALTAVMFGAMSVWVSARARSTRGAVAGSYLWAFLFSAVTFLVLIGEVFLFRYSTNDVFGPGGRELYSLWPNPLMAMVSAVDEPVELESFGFSPNPFSPMDGLLRARQQSDNNSSGIEERFAVDAFEQELVLDAEQVLRAPIVREPVYHRGPLWVRTVALYLILTAVFVWRATVAVLVPPRRRRLKATDASP